MTDPKSTRRPTHEEIVETIAKGGVVEVWRTDVTKLYGNHWIRELYIDGRCMRVHRSLGPPPVTRTVIVDEIPEEEVPRIVAERPSDKLLSLQGSSCARCGGTGQILIGIGVDEAVSQRLCTNCDGTGRVGETKDEYCPECRRPYEEGS